MPLASTAPPVANRRSMPRVSVSPQSGQQARSAPPLAPRPLRLPRRAEVPCRAPGSLADQLKDLAEVRPQQRPPARRLRPVGAIIVAVRSPTPWSPEKVSSSAPRPYPYRCTREIGRGDPAALRPCRSAAASERCVLAAPAISTPVTSAERSQTRPAWSKTSPSWSRRSRLRNPGPAPRSRRPPRGHGGPAEAGDRADLLE